MLNSRHGFWKVGRRAGAWLSGGWAFCFLGAASRLLSHRWGTVKLDDCNLPGQNSERDHLRLAFEQGHSIGRADPLKRLFRWQCASAGANLDPISDRGPRVPGCFSPRGFK